MVISFPSEADADAAADRFYDVFMSNTPEGAYKVDTTAWDIPFNDSGWKLGDASHLGGYFRSPSPYITLLYADTAEFNIPLTVANLASSVVGDKFDYINKMYIGVNTPDGYILGTPIPNTDTYSLSGSSSGLSIDSVTGQITITDETQITAAGDLSVNVVCSDGTFPITIPVVDNDSNTLFISNSGSNFNDGLQPHKPKRSPYDGAYSTFSKKLYRRGGIFDTILVVSSNQTSGSYGDPSSNRPLIEYSTDGVSSYYTDNLVLQQERFSTGDNKRISLTNVIVEDLILDGVGTAIRGIDMYDYKATGNDFIINRVCIQNTADHPNSAGVYLFLISGKATIKWLETTNIYGDSLYATFTSGVSIGFSELGTPNGGAADNFQTTHEANESQRVSNVYVHDCIMRRDPLATSTKGAIAIEGTDNWLVENNWIQGGFFGISANGTNGVMRNNFFPYVSLTDNTNTWGIGAGSQYDATDIIAVGNTICNSELGLLISGFNGPFQRYDFTYHSNTIYNSVRSVKMTEAWSGLIVDNLLINVTNEAPLVTGNGANTATGGDYTTRTISGQIGQTTYSTQPPLSLFSGTFEDEETITVTSPTMINEWADYTVTYTWYLNHVEISGATSSSYTIPAGTAADTQDNMPEGMQEAELSCRLLWTDELSNQVYSWAADSEGTIYKTVA